MVGVGSGASASVPVVGRGLSERHLGRDELRFIHLWHHGTLERDLWDGNVTPGTPLLVHFEKTEPLLEPDEAVVP